MRILPSLASLALVCSLHALHAKDLKTLANQLKVPTQLSATQDRLPLPAVPAGVSIRIKGVDYEELLSRKGERKGRILSKVPVAVSYELRRGKETVTSPDYIVNLLPRNPLSPEESKIKLPIIPEPLQWSPAGGEWKLPRTLNIIGPESVTAPLARALKEHFGVTSTTDEKASMSIRFIDASHTKAMYIKGEAYQMGMSPRGIHIIADSKAGYIWATNSLLQLLKASGGKKSIPNGIIIDIPRYPVRGFMLDVGRSPVPMSRLYELVDQLSWYKMNELQIHLNDNFIFHEHYVDAGKDPFKESYTGYRLESKVKGKDGTALTSTDLSYSKKEFARLIAYAAKKGVKIIPEFDTPGHALSFTRVRPDLIYQGPMGGKEKRRCEMLDAANPETLRFVSSVLDEYMAGKKPLFRRGSVVHLGADEFYGDAEDYRKYTDGLLRYAKKRGYTPRIWGSLSMKRGKTPIISEGVEVSLWNHGWSGAWETIKQGYDVINMNDGALYIVPLAGYYRMDKNHNWVYNNWKPNQIGNDLIPAGHPQLKGAMFAVWNDEIDLLHHGQSYDDYAPAITDSIGILAQKMWAPQKPILDAAGKPLNLEAYKKQRLAPLGTQLASKQQGAEALGLSKSKIAAGTELKLESLQPPYHLVMEIELEPVAKGSEQILLQAPDGSTVYASDKEGKVAMRRDDTLRFQWDASLPTGRPVKVELIGTLGKTTLLIDGKEVAHDKLKLQSFNTRQKKLYNTFRLPLHTVAPKLKGKINKMEIKKK